MDSITHLESVQVYSLWRNSKVISFPEDSKIQKQYAQNENWLSSC